MSTKISISFTQKCRLVPLHRARLRKVLTEILVDHHCSGLLSVAVVDDAVIRKLHRDFLGKDSATDVISFPLEQTSSAAGVESGPFGEVVASAERALSQARKQGISPERELALYAIHGTLHLMGYDDRDASSRRRMRLEERRYLELFDRQATPSGPRGRGPAQSNLPQEQLHCGKRRPPGRG